MRAPRRIPIAALLLAPLSACSAGADGERRATDAPLARGEIVMPIVATVDGVRTMTHDAAAFDRAPRLEVDPAPIAVLGAPDDDPAYDLTNVAVVALLSDGRAATLSPVGARVLVFGPDGPGERSLGRQGRGPGELMAPWGLVALAGDTLLVPDPGNARFNWATAVGGIVREATMPPDTLLMYGSPVGGALDDGRVTIVVASHARSETEGEIWWRSCTLALLEPATARTSIVAIVPCSEVATFETRRRGRRRLDTDPLRLGRRLHVASLGSALVTGRGDGYSFEHRAPTGAVESRVRVDRPRRAVTATMRDSVVARELASLDGPRAERLLDAAEERRIAREAPFSDSLPPYSAFHSSRDGTLWIVDAIAPTDTAWSATAFRANGAIVGRLHAPGRGVPMAFEGDRVAVREEDADGIVTVRVHRIRPARAGS